MEAGRVPHHALSAHRRVRFVCAVPKRRCKMKILFPIWIRCIIVVPALVHESLPSMLLELSRTLSQPERQRTSACGACAPRRLDGRRSQPAWKGAKEYCTRRGRNRTCIHRLVHPSPLYGHTCFMYQSLKTILHSVSRTYPRCTTADVLRTPLASGLVSYVDSSTKGASNSAAYEKTLQTVFEAPFSGDAYFMASSYYPIFMNLTRIGINGTAVGPPMNMIYCNTYAWQVPYSGCVFKSKYHIFSGCCDPMGTFFAFSKEIIFQLTTQVHRRNKLTWFTAAHFPGKSPPAFFSLKYFLDHHENYRSYSVQ